MKSDWKLKFRYKKRPLLAVFFGGLLLILSLVSFSVVQAYDIIVDNNVDSDSDIDSTANVGTDGATSYLDAQDQDDTDQTLIEADNGGAGATTEYIAESFTDSVARWNSDANSYDGDWGTAMNYNAGAFATADAYPSGYSAGFDTATSGTGTITQVDIIVRMEISGLDTSDQWGISLDVGASTGTYLQAMTTANYALNNLTFTDVTEPNDGTWTWGEIQSAQIHYDEEKVGGGDKADWSVYELSFKVSTGGGVDYQLNWEHSIASVDIDKDFYVLTVYGQATGGDSETFSLYLWDLIAVDWTDTGQDIGTSETWYNWTLTVGFADCIGTTMYINYRSNTDGSDTTQSTLNVDYAGIRGYNFTTYGLPNFNSLSIPTDTNYYAFIDSPISFVVESGITYNVQLRATDKTLTPITDGYIYFNTVDNSGTSTQLTTSYQDLYLSQAKGNNTHDIYFWVYVNWSPGEAGITQGLWEFTIEIDVTGA